MALGPNDLVSSHFTLTGSQPMTPPRFAFAERVAAAAGAGFAGIGLLGEDYLGEQAQGLTDADAVAILADHGLELAEVEFVFDWSAGDDEPERRENGRQLEDHVWAVADTFGPRVVSVGELVPAEMLPPFEQLADRFGALCDRAADHGLLVALEFMPFCGIPDIATGRALVEAVGRANAGLNVDSYHYFRGNPDPDVLRAVGDRVFMIQLDDADAEVVGELFEDTMLRRRYPGDGSLDLVRFLQILDEGGASAPKSVEILSSDNQALAVEDAARRAHDATRAVVDAARKS
jgi:sugar phosphate isomerase/epimerase